MLLHIIAMLLLHALPRFSRTNPTWPVMIAIAVMCAGVLAARAGLTPFRELRRKLTAVRSGEATRVHGSYPTEVQPLIDDLNALLEDRENAVKRAVATAGDLAHGLKTPLALLSQEADHAAAAGNSAIAQNIAQQVERMSRQVDYHLARARAAASGSSGAPPCPVTPCSEALLRTLAKLHAARALHFSSHIPPHASVRVQRQDLDEILGNLLDNAAKWAASKVVLEASQSAAMLVLTVDDDGPGLPPALRSVVLNRGVRLDEAAPGSGLGLAIVRDLVEIYGGSIALIDSPLGGLRAQVTLPAS